jgi:hypothetical protein
VSWHQTREKPPADIDAVGGQVWAMWENDIAYIVPATTVRGNPNKYRAWCRIENPPEYVEPPKYRTPTIRDLLDGPIDCEVQVSDKWVRARLRAVDTYPSSTTSFFATHQGGTCWFANCRVEDTLVSSRVS